MAFARQYIEDHLSRGRYLSRIDGTGCERYLHAQGWEDAIAHEDMIFSHRCTDFDTDRFTNVFHAHPYYEMVVYCAGEVEYLNEGRKIHPSHCTVIWNAPSQMHTAHLLRACTYERFVLCFDPAFFGEAATTALGFMKAHPEGAMHPDGETATRLLTLLSSIKEAACTQGELAPLLLRARIVELFYALNAPSFTLREGHSQSAPLLPVKQYIDDEYATIGNIGEIAARFFYSREHLSRRFREEFNLPISEYLAKRRVLCSLPLLREMSVAQAAYAVGFRSQSAYIAAFKRTMGCLPCAYRRGRE